MLDEHFDRIAEAAPGFEVVAHTADCPIAATQNVEKKLYAVQFHPEVLHTKNGTQMIYNFVRGVCGCAGTWKMDSFVKNTIEEIREQVGDGKVLLALSGGVDSSVLAALLAKAIGKQLTCVFVDHGLLRKNEGDEVEGVFGKGGSFDINFVRVNAQERYYSKLQASQSLSASVRSSVRNSSVYSRKKLRKSERLTSLRREPSILT